MEVIYHLLCFVSAVNYSINLCLFHFPFQVCQRACTSCGECFHKNTIQFFYFHERCLWNICNCKMNRYVCEFSNIISIMSCANPVQILICDMDVIPSKVCQWNILRKLKSLKFWIHNGVSGQRKNYSLIILISNQKLFCMHGLLVIYMSCNC